MKIASPELDKIIIELSPDDMRELDIKYEEMDYSSAETRKVFRALLEKAERELGRRIDPARRMMIETVPEVCGGCLVCFTILEDAFTQENAGQGDCLVAGFCGIDELLDAARAFSAAGIMPGKAELFENSGALRLVISGADSRAKSFFCEFADHCLFGEAAAAQTREHWKAAGSCPLFTGQSAKG